MSETVRTQSIELGWQASPHARRLLSLSAAAIVLGLILGRPAVCCLAAIPVSFLFVGRQPLASMMVVKIVLSAQTVFESEPLAVTVTVQVEPAVSAVRIAVEPAASVQWRDGSSSVGHAVVEGSMRVQRWGKHDLGDLRVLLTDDSGLSRAHHLVDIGEIAVLPRPSPVARSTVSALRGGFTGDHRSPREGAGTEFRAIRPYQSGDSQSRINWTVSARTGTLHVTTRRSEDAVDVVVLVDALSDVGPPGRSTLDISVRGATGLVRSVLRVHDRVGLVALGGTVSWVRPQFGGRQFERVAAAMLDVIGRATYLDPDLKHLPPHAIPAGAHVVTFSPLLDARVLPNVAALRARNLNVLIVDVLSTQPSVATQPERLARRMWRLEREATMGALADLGIPVVHWDGAAPLDVWPRPLSRTRMRL